MSTLRPARTLYPLRCSALLLVSAGWGPHRPAPRVHRWRLFVTPAGSGFTPRTHCHRSSWRQWMAAPTTITSASCDERSRPRKQSPQDSCVREQAAKDPGEVAHVSVTEESLGHPLRIITPWPLSGLIHPHGGPALGHPTESLWSFSSFTSAASRCRGRGGSWRCWPTRLSCPPRWSVPSDPLQKPGTAPTTGAQPRLITPASRHRRSKTRRIRCRRTLLPRCPPLRRMPLRADFTAPLPPPR